MLRGRGLARRVGWGHRAGLCRPALEWVGAPGAAAEAHELAQERPVEEDAEEEEHRARDGGDDAVAPAVQPDQCRRHAQHPAAERGFAAAATLGARPAASLPADED